MKCQSDGFWRSYLDEDGMLLAGQREEAREHLDVCDGCRAVFAGAAENAVFAGQILTSPETPNMSWTKAAARGEYAGGRKPIFLPRGAAVAAGLALVFVGLLALPPVRGIASDLLQIFRVEKFEAVRIDPKALENMRNEILGKLKFEYKEPEFNRVGSVEEAAQKSGLELKEPVVAPDLRRDFTVQSGAEISATFDLEALRRYATDRRATNFSLPDNLDGATVTAVIPPIVSIDYSKADFSHVLSFVQAGIAEVKVPAGIDFDQVRDELFKLPLFPEDLKTRLVGVTDWKRTLPIPYPEGYYKTEKALVAGRYEALYLSADGPNNGNDKGFIWTDGKKTYGLFASDQRGGGMSRAELFGTANSLYQGEQ